MRCGAVQFGASTARYATVQFRGAGCSIAYSAPQCTAEILGQRFDLGALVEATSEQEAPARPPAPLWADDVSTDLDAIGTSKVGRPSRQVKVSGTVSRQWRGSLPLYGSLRELRRLLSGGGGRGRAPRVAGGHLRKRLGQGSLQLGFSTNQKDETVASARLGLAPVTKSGAPLVSKGVALSFHGSGAELATALQGPHHSDSGDAHGSAQRSAALASLSVSVWLDPLHVAPAGWTPTVPVCAEASVCGVLARDHYM